MSIIYDLVKSEIDKIPVKRSTPGRTYILCPYHSEKTPSGRILHVYGSPGVGNYKCYGCGVTKSWNELASTLGLKLYGKKEARRDSQSVPKHNFENSDDDLLYSKIQKEKLKIIPLSSMKTLLSTGLHKTGVWRGFKLQFLHSLGFKFCKAVDSGRTYLYMPVSVKGVERGYIKAQLFKPKLKSIPSYINSPGSWSLKYGLFLYDQAIELMQRKNKSTLVLVEGPRDALRLLRFGIPTIAIMGTHSWSKGKMHLLELSGASRIVLMMDGDKAGKAASSLISKGCRASGEEVAKPLNTSFEVKIVRLWYDPKAPDIDPGNCSTDILYSVRRLVK